MKKYGFDGARMCLRVLTGLSVSLYAANAQAFTVSPIHSFGVVTGDGSDPEAGLTKRNNYLWGTTCTGGGGNTGTVYRFQISNPANYSVMYSFSGLPDGYCPAADLTLVAPGGGTMYGTTWFGGNFSGYDGGTIFKIQTTAPFLYLQLYRFNGAPADGERPHGQLAVQGGMLWGTTELGGASSVGTLFNAPLSGGSDAILHSFQPLSTQDGSVPEAGVTYLPASGVFVGTTGKGGNNTDGTAFKYSGSYNKIHSFGPGNTPPDGATPRTKLIKIGAYLYGATGGNTVFKMTPAGNVVAVTNFAGAPTDGDSPVGDLVYANLGGGPRIYGTTNDGGINDMGTVFEIDPATMAETGHVDFNGANGAYPVSGLRKVTIAGVTTLYGTTTEGGGTGCGGNGCGTILKVQ